MAQFPADIPLAVELREENWFRDIVAQNELFDLLEAQNISTVITDTAGRRDVLHNRLTTTTAFVRFTANDLHPTDFSRMDAWIAVLKRWQELGLERLYFFVHSPSHAQMPRLVNYAVKQLNQLPGINLQPCRFLDEEQPQLF